jgi:hypothetical protein
MGFNDTSLRYEILEEEEEVDTLNNEVQLPSIDKIITTTDINRDLLNMMVEGVKKNKNNSAYNIRFICNSIQDLNNVLFVFQYKHEHNPDYKISKNKLRTLDDNIKIWIERGIFNSDESQHISKRKGSWIISIKMISTEDICNMYKRLLLMITSHE